MCGHLSVLFTASATLLIFAAHKLAIHYHFYGHLCMLDFSGDMCLFLSDILHDQCTRSGNVETRTYAAYCPQSTFHCEHVALQVCEKLTERLKIMTPFKNGYRPILSTLSSPIYYILVNNIISMTVRLLSIRLRNK